MMVFFKSIVIFIGDARETNMLIDGCAERNKNLNEYLSMAVDKGKVLLLKLHNIQYRTLNKNCLNERTPIQTIIIIIYYFII